MITRPRTESRNNASHRSRRCVRCSVTATRSHPAPAGWRPHVGSWRRPTPPAIELQNGE